jgi:peptidoglycan/LPS O-acetylase OafA/YrhL
MTERILRPVMPELDAIRGIAILMVMVYHGFYWQVDLAGFPRWERILMTAAWSGRLGVNLFFVLSGFLITGLLIDSRSRADYYSRFYVRRALRILPAYFAMLLILAMAHQLPWRFGLLSVAYLSNLTPLFRIAVAYPVLWSLAVEEHFYLVWPAMVRRISLNGLLIVCSGVVLASPLLRFASFHYANGFEFNDYTWNSADGLACGAILAAFVRKTEESQNNLRLLVIFSVCIAVLLSRFSVFSRTKTGLGAALQVVPWHAAFVALLGTFLLIGSSSRYHLVQSPILRFFGHISYGLYLVHLWVFEVCSRYLAAYNIAARFIVASALSILLAYLSRLYFEERFLRWKENPPLLRERLAGALRLKASN